jgi:ElaB/YqjD/DUF883 family membrane-anchored ribosome-binding protein
MQKDYYEPMEPRPTNEAGEYTSGSTATMTESSDGSGGITQQAGEIASKAQEKAGAAADMGVDRAATGLHTAAEKMRDRASSTSGVQAQVGEKAADYMEKASTYLQDHDSQELWGEVEKFVKEHPMQAAAGALFAGFMLGRMMR